uniref:40S ribosomal protein S15-4 n=1 Tax=Tanacetum cinerariifolium TaxID=118510 RepID=A0A699HLH0_TANCI|nr:40S ribosomal protein S15-4 [Tanacetum cinerariifolium]
MEGQEPDVAVANKRTFKKFSFRGVDLDALLDMSSDELVKMFTARARRSVISGSFETWSANAVIPVPPAIALHQFCSVPPNNRVRLLFLEHHHPFLCFKFLTSMFLLFLICMRNVKHLLVRSLILVKTHLRNMIIVPEMIGSIVGVYNGKTFNQIEIKPEMIGHYLAEFSISYKPVKHGRPGIGATHSSRFIPLKRGCYLDDGFVTLRVLILFPGSILSFQKVKTLLTIH